MKKDNIGLQDVRKPSVERRKFLQALIQKENAAAKKTVINWADKVPNPFMLRRPSGIMQLDIDLAGGLPAGTLDIIAGPDGAGKTALMYKYMAMQQRIFGEACLLALCNVEAPPDHFFMRKCGMKVAIPDELIDQKQEELERLGLPLLTTAQIKEYKVKVGELVIINEDTGEKMLDQVLRLMATKIFNIIGVDSFSAFQTDAESQTESLADFPRQAASASTLTRFSYRLHPLLAGMEDQNRTTLIGTCQVRANRDRANAPSHIQKYLPPYVPVIPWALRHAMTAALLIYPGEKLKVKSGDDKGKKIGKVLCWRTFKGKAGIHEDISGETDYTFEGLVDNTSTVIEAAIAHGILVEKAKTVEVHRHTGELLLDFPGMTDVREALGRDIEFEMRVRMEILAAAKVSCVCW